MFSALFSGTCGQCAAVCVNEVCFLPCLQALVDSAAVCVNEVCFLPCLQALVDSVLQYV